MKNDMYNIYVMAAILNVNDPTFAEMELDEQWSTAQIVYEKFTLSEFNIDTSSEIDCIEEFVKSITNVKYLVILENHKQVFHRTQVLEQVNLHNKRSEQFRTAFESYEPSFVNEEGDGFLRLDNKTITQVLKEAVK